MHNATYYPAHWETALPACTHGTLPGDGCADKRGAIQLGVVMGYFTVDWARVHKDVSSQVQKLQIRYEHESIYDIAFL